MTDQEQPPKKPAGVTSVIAGAASVVIVVIICIVGCVNRKQDQDREGRSVDAKLSCRQFVEQRLIAPATAEYSDEHVAWDQTSNVYTVTGQVDAQNRVGVPLRRSFRCEVFPVGDDDQWRLKALTGLD